MTTLHITRGLPASGKTTWAEKWVSEDPASRVRVNRDDLRQMLNQNTRIKGVTEPRVMNVRDASIVTMLRSKVDVVCDDTNLPLRVVRDLERLAKQGKARFQIHDMTDVSVDVCVERDATRKNPVGEAVIRDHYMRFIHGKGFPLDVPASPAPVVRYRETPGLPWVVLVDIDGTVARMAGRSPYDWSRVGEDQPHWEVIEVVKALRLEGWPLVFMSGRSQECRRATEKWLTDHVGGEWRGLHMRAAGDNRKDSVVKAELFDQHIRGHFNVLCVLDDRDQVVEMWRAMGLKVLQVAEGAF